MPSRRAPVCVPCGRSMVCETNGHPVQDGETDICGVVSLSYADEFRCPTCGHGILIGFSDAFLTKTPPRERVVVR